MEEMKSDREVSEFLLRACHDLRSPARAVRTYSELFLRDSGGLEGPAVAQRIGFIVDGARKIDALLDGLAAYAVALQTDSSSFQSSRLDVLLRSVLAKMDKELRAGGAEVVYGELPLVAGNLDRLMQVFEHLLRNALAYRGETPPRISIDAARQGEDWLLTVRDNGPGVEAESLEKIFRPFERLQAKSGTGMGLAICRAIVERHGGRIWAESDGQRGSVFCFTLPAV